MSNRAGHDGLNVVLAEPLGEDGGELAVVLDDEYAQTTNRLRREESDRRETSVGRVPTNT
jgi:hypothetical protein